MNSLLIIEGQVLSCLDEVRSFPVRDKDGLPTNISKDHRVIKIQLLVTLSDKSMVAVNCEGFDNPSTFASPKIGDKIKLSCRAYSLNNGFHSVKF